jgi:hypothetical protein
MKERHLLVTRTRSAVVGLVDHVLRVYFRATAYPMCLLSTTVRCLN